MAQIAPWIIPPSPLAASQAGASLGLQVRGQDIAQDEAGDRMKLAYAQLAEEEKARNQAAQARLQQANAAMALKSQQLTLLDQYRQQRVKEQQAALEQRRDLTTAALQLRAQPKLHFGTEGEVLAEQPDGSVIQLRPPRDKPQPLATVTEPVNPDDPFGAKVTQKITPEAAAARLKAAADAAKNKPVVDDRSGITKLFDRLTGKATPATAAPSDIGVDMKSGTETKLSHPAFATPDQVKGAYQTGKITREQAKKILADQFGYQ